MKLVIYLKVWYGLRTLADETIIRFDEVSFGFGHKHPILSEVDFSVRRGSKITLMGQNGAGKSTIFKLLTREIQPDSGKINVSEHITVATARQVIPREQMEMTVREYFQNCFTKKVYDIDPRIDTILEAVNLHAPHDRIIKSFSGGQQARLLLAGALIQNPDLLLLDEPTNNLDKEGIAHLTRYIQTYPKTCIVISHDADFLNSFTEGVLYLDVFTRKIEQYTGNYFDVREQITARVEKENMKNAQLAKTIQEKKDKANFFANKGGKMRILAKRMRTLADEMEEAKVDVRREDKTIRPFIIPAQEDVVGEVIKITDVTVIRSHHNSNKRVKISLKKNQHLQICGPNGIGKSTLLENLASGKSKSATITPGIRVGYYRQDFSTLNFEDTVYESLQSVMKERDEHRLRSVASSFLIAEDFIGSKIGNLSEGQKGLVAFASLVLQKPGLLILDEPTNHINFRHLPIIAEALNKYQGAMIIVSHVPEFINKIRIDEVLDLNS